MSQTGLESIKERCVFLDLRRESEKASLAWKAIKPKATNDLKIIK